MLRIPWAAQQTKISIINEIQEEVRLSIICEGHILGYFGHVIMREVKNLKKDIFLGKAPGETGRGRSPFRWSDISEARMSSVVRAASQA